MTKKTRQDRRHTVIVSCIFKILLLLLLAQSDYGDHDHDHHDRVAQQTWLQV